MNRRSFIKKSMTTGMLVTGSGVLLQACKATLRSDLMEKEASADRKVEPLDRQRYKMLYYASLAPSGHNTQPWFVRIISADEWIIGSDRRRWLPTVDPHNREALLSIGAFVENLSLAAGVFGYTVKTDILTADTRDEEVLRVGLEKAKPKNYPLQRLTSRMTAKGGMLPTELQKTDLAALSEPFDGHLFYFPAGTKHADCIAEGVIENYRIQTRRDEAQRELGEWIRFGDRQAGLMRDGLTTQGMEIHGLAGWYVRNFMDKKDVMDDSFRRKSIEKTVKQAGAGAGWLIITGKDRTVADLIETGRRFERMALLAREHMIAIHPMTQHLEEENGLSQIAAHHGSGTIPQFILRVGYLNHYPAPVSLRRPVDWFLRS